MSKQHVAVTGVIAVGPVNPVLGTVFAKRRRRVYRWFKNRQLFGFLQRQVHCPVFELCRVGTGYLIVCKSVLFKGTGQAVYCHLGN